MPDQIFAPGPLPAPLKYNVPGSQRMIPRACQAVFNGSGASGDFVPTLIFRSQAGHVISRAILQSTITAGDDAEVSWFPGVKPAPTGGGVTALPQRAVMYLSGAAFGDSPFSVPAGGNTNIQFPRWNGGSGSLLSFQPAGAYSDTILLESTDYLYVFHASWKWATIGITTQVFIEGPEPQLDGSFLWGALDFHGETFANTFVTGGPFPGDNLFGVDTKMFLCDTVPQAVTLNALHGSATAKDIIEANLVCIAYKVF